MNARAETGAADRTRHRLSDCIAVTAEFVAAQPAGPARALARHRRLADGNCASCVATPSPLPCTTAVIAQLAGRLPATPGLACSSSHGALVAELKTDRDGMARKW